MHFFERGEYVQGALCVRLRGFCVGMPGAQGEYARRDRVSTPGAQGEYARRAG